MRKLIAAINMTLDGYCDHTAVDPDEEIHQYYARLLDEAGLLLYGRTTYQLMQYWQTLLSHPSGEPSMDAFARAIDRVPKLVFSRTLKETGWASATLATAPLTETVQSLRQQPGKNLYVGSPGLIVQLTGADLIDEYQICLHPVLAGGGLPLFRELSGHRNLTLVRTRTFRSGAVLLVYQPGQPLTDSGKNTEP